MMSDEVDTISIIARALKDKFGYAAIEVAAIQADAATEESREAWIAVLATLRNERLG